MEPCQGMPLVVGSQVDNAMREASEWVARLNADDVSERDRSCFEQWRSSHHLHASTYAELYSTWLRLVACGAGTRVAQSSADQVLFGRSL